MHDRDQKHVVMVDEINRFTTLLSSWLTTSPTAARTVEEILIDQNTISEKVEDFRNAMHERGLVPPTELVADGKFHRFSTNGKPFDDAGWYNLASLII